MHRESRPNTPTGPRPTPAGSRQPVRPAIRVVPGRHQTSRHAKEQQYQRLSLIGAGVIVAVVAVLLGIGWYQSYVQPYHATVLKVGKMTASMDYFVKRVKQELPQFAQSDAQTVVSVVPDSTADQITQEFVVLQRAPLEGVTATDQEIQQEIQKELGVATVNGTAPDRTAFEADLRSELGATGLSLAEYQQQIRATVLKNKVQDKLNSDYPRTGPAAQYQEMLFNQQDDAKTYLGRLNNGESWDTVAAALRANPTIGSVAQFDFQPKIEIDDKLSGPLFALSNGQHTDIINTSDGKYTIAQLVNRDDQHQITDDQINAIAPKLYSNWMDDQKKAITIKQNLTDTQRVFAVQAAGYQPPSQSQQQSQPVQPPAPQPAVQPAVPGAGSLPPGIATPPGGLVAPPVPAGAPGSTGP